MAFKIMVLLLTMCLPTATKAFQVTQTPPVPTTANEVVHKQHIHEFWGHARSRQEIKAHIRACLHGCEPTIDVVSAEPPLLVIHDFLSTQMCHEIINAAKNTGNMQRSTVGSTQETSGTRTSSTVWLKDHECPNALRLIAEKLSSITGLPPGFMENLQIVRYEPGQEFNLHTDHLDYFNDLECRGRLATCLIYLAQPTAGGDTWFPGINDKNNNNVRIPATQGSAVIFWNTIQRPGSTDYSPEMYLHTDQRMQHAGLAVEAGEKWICNRWIHPIDFGAGVRGL